MDRFENASYLAWISENGGFENDDEKSVNTLPFISVFGRFSVGGGRKRMKNLRFRMKTHDGGQVKKGKC